MNSRSFDFLIVGAGIFGLATAVELALRKHKVCVLNPDKIPHPLAASTDISKVVRIEYGKDEEYMDMTLDSIEGWRAWNEVFDRPLYHETGFLVLSGAPLENDISSFAGASYLNLLKRGYHPDRLNSQLIAAMFPAFNSEVYRDGFYNPTGGYVESGKVIEALADYARSLGCTILEGQLVDELIVNSGKVISLKTRTGESHTGGHFIICAGQFTTQLLPELSNQLFITGHPVFHLKVDLPAAYMPPDFPVFAADIAHTGWYGFPYHPMAQVVKVANHGIGKPVDPLSDPRQVSEEDTNKLRTFLKISIPGLANAEVHFTRLCCYTDTLDGHFWIDNHPGISNLTVATGGSGHAFKMGPVLGDMIADLAEKGSHNRSGRYAWRENDGETLHEEEARHTA